LSGTIQPLAGLVPASAVAGWQAVRSRCDLYADFGQMLIHRLGIDGRLDNRRTDAVGRTDRAEDVNGIMARITI
jgi:hypothetical protein